VGEVAESSVSRVVCWVLRPVVVAPPVRWQRRIRPPISEKGIQQMVGETISARVANMFPLRGTGREYRPITDLGRRLRLGRATATTLSTSRTPRSRSRMRGDARGDGFPPDPRPHGGRDWPGQGRAPRPLPWLDAVCGTPGGAGRERDFERHVIARSTRGGPSIVPSAQPISPRRWPLGRLHLGRSDPIRKS